MSRHAGSIVRGNSKPRRISAFQRAGSRWRLSTASRAKGQGTGCRGGPSARSPGVGMDRLIRLPSRP